MTYLNCLTTNPEFSNKGASSPHNPISIMNTFQILTPQRIEDTQFDGFVEVNADIITLGDKKFYPQYDYYCNTKKFSVVFDRDTYEFDNEEDAILFSMGGQVVQDIDELMDARWCREGGFDSVKKGHKLMPRMSRLELAQEDIDAMHQDGLITKEQCAKMHEGATEYEACWFGY